MTEKQTQVSSMTEKTSDAGQLEGHERSGEMKPDNTRFGTHSEGFTWEGKDQGAPDPRLKAEGEEVTTSKTTRRSSVSKPQ